MYRSSIGSNQLQGMFQQRAQLQLICSNLQRVSLLEEPQVKPEEQGCETVAGSSVKGHLQASDRRQLVLRQAQLAVSFQVAAALLLGRCQRLLLLWLR